MMIHIGVDWAQKDGDKTCITFARREDDGTITMIGTLWGEAAEYVVQLEAENKRLWKHIEILMANTSKSVVRRLNVQGIDLDSKKGKASREVIDG